MSEYRDDFREAQREAIWTLPRIVLGVLLIMLSIYGLGFLATGGDLAIYRFWAPKQENAKRVVFENTQSYIQGKQEYISRLRLEYQQAQGSYKDALRTLILDEASTVDINQLRPDLAAFIRGLQGGL